MIVIGAGPAGLATALLLSKRGHKVTVYEARKAFDFDARNSYPIGVNPRGQETLRQISPEVLQKLKDGGRTIEAFNIWADTRRVASLESGTLIAATRAHVTQLLHEEAQRTDRITIKTGHRLVDLDFDNRLLKFETANGDVVVDASESRVIAADGTHSRVRRSLAEQIRSFHPRTEDWGVDFRVLRSEPGAQAPKMDPNIHHIFTSRGAYAAAAKDGSWNVVLSAGENDRELLLSHEPTEENTTALRNYVCRYAPLASELLGPDEYRAFFGRKSFSGAVVRCDRLAFEEWAILIGDAAHSVIPPTGEGVNSALEDARLLAEAEGSATWFADFESSRLPDLQALGVYATVLKNNLNSTDPARSAADVIVRILDTAAARLGLPSASVEQRLFGPEAGVLPYRTAIGPWIHQRFTLHPKVQSAVRRLLRMKNTPFSAE
ncbi:MAG TPA: FAD-dependent monooxygenase [Brevibacterium ravenspurgense]|nr:FAD-dependent monooxygenase [Brevibacterium ravenspurgense]